MSLQRCQQETTSNEFLGWVQFLSEESVSEANRFSALHQHLAQITLELVRLRGVLVKAKTDHLRIDDFVLTFGEKGPEDKIAKPAKTKEEKMALSKAIWGYCLHGINVIKSD